MEKKRAMNFSKLETDLLIQLVEQQKEILECSKLDAISRNSAWREITRNFNQHRHARTVRDEKMLKKKYSNIKSHTKNWTIPTETMANSSPELESCDLSNKHQTDEIESPKHKVFITNYDEAIRPCPMEKLINSDSLNSQNYFNAATHFSNVLHAYGTTNADSTKDFCNQNCNYYDDHQNTEAAWNALYDIKTKWSQEKAKLEIDILEIEHRERLKIMKVKHSMEMDKLELEKEKHRLEIELLSMEVEFKRKNLYNGV